MALIKLWAGRYETNVECECCGLVIIEKCGIGEFLWESHCSVCKKCDPNGWPTLARAHAEAPAYFNR